MAPACFNIFRLSGTAFDGAYEQTMTGAKGSELAEMQVENLANMEFYEMTCRQMLISRVSGPLTFKGREHVQVIFVEFPLSDDGTRATHSLEVLLRPSTT